MINQYYQYEGEQLHKKVKGIKNNLPVSHDYHSLTSKLDEENVMINIIGEHICEDLDSCLMYLVSLDVTNRNIEAHVAIGGASKEITRSPHQIESRLLKLFDMLFTEEGFTIYETY